MRKFPALLVAFLALPTAGDNAPVRITPTVVATQVAHAAVRGGDAAAGREAFIDLRCSRCHGVDGDERIRRDDCVPLAPALRFAGEDRQTIAAAILARSPLGDAWAEADRSGMSEATSRMTFRQLANVIEYLRAEK